MHNFQITISKDKISSLNFTFQSNTTTSNNSEIFMRKWSKYRKQSSSISTKSLGRNLEHEIKILLSFNWIWYIKYGFWMIICFNIPFKFACLTRNCFEVFWLSYSCLSWISKCEIFLSVERIYDKCFSDKSLKIETNYIEQWKWYYINIYTSIKYSITESTIENAVMKIVQ